MSNAGLAERGDARIWFGPEADGDPVLYEKLRGLVEKGLEGALERRDHSVRAYQSLMRLWNEDRAGYRTELARFIDVHARAMAPTLGPAVCPTQVEHAPGRRAGPNGQ